MDHWDVASALNQVRTRIQQAEALSNCRNAVTLIAVSKKKPAVSIREAALAGLRDFGESYAQEALEKINQLTDLTLTWHFIGPIQTNKVKLIAGTFDWVHSVDRLKIAQKLNDHRSDNRAPLNICLQVNVSNELTKSGICRDLLPDLLESVIQLPYLKLRGLMAIPSPSQDPAAQRQVFRELAQIQKAMTQQFNYPLDVLSMGMSGDLEAAIAEGATMVRIGTAIFGHR